jgi:hypothetical protein
MIDLITDLCGGLIIAVLGTLYLKRKSATDWADLLLEPGFEEIAARFRR